MRLIFAKLWVVLLVAHICTNIYAQSAAPTNYYVVIGVYKTLPEAEKITDAANMKGFTAQYAIHESNEYYVFLLQTTDKKKANEFRKKILKETEYKDAWIFKGKLGGQ